MYCQNCGNKTKEDSMFCSSCGTDLKKPVLIKDTQENAEITTNVSDKTTNVFNSIISVVFFIFAFVIGRFIGLVVILFVGAWSLGEWFPKWYMKREKVNVTLVKLIVWSNILTWLLPPLGIATGFTALGLSNYFPGERKKYKIVAIIGIVASLLNAISGVLINL